MKIEHAWARVIVIIITSSFLNNWKWENLDEKQDMQQWKHCSNALKLFKVRLRLCVFIRKFLAATKKLKTNYTFFVKPTCFLLIQEAIRSMTNFWLLQNWLYQTRTDILQTFSTIKLIPEAYLEVSRTSAIKIFVIFPKKRKKKLHRR